MGEQGQSVNNKNYDDFSDLGRKIFDAVRVIDKETIPKGGLNEEDVYIRALMDMAGVPGINLELESPEKAVPAVGAKMQPSSRIADTMFIDFSGLNPQQAQTFVKSLNKMMGTDEPGTEKAILKKNNPSDSAYTYSVQIPISEMKKLVPQVDQHLDNFLEAKSVKEGKDTFIEIDVDPNRGKATPNSNLNFTVKPPGM